MTSKREEIELTAAEIRDVFGRQRLPLPTKRRLDEALKSVGITVTPSLAEVISPDEVVRLRVTSTDEAGGRERATGPVPVRRRSPVRVRRVRSLGERIGKLVGGMAAIGGAAALIGGVVAVLQPEPSPAPMSGDLNIAFAQFSVSRSRGAEDDREGITLTESAYDLLKRESLAAAKQDPRSPLAIQVRGPLEVGRIDGNTPQDRAKSAAKLASRINADVVIYGNASFAEGGSELVAEFYVSPRQLPDAEELAGGYELGKAIRTPADATLAIPSRAELRTSLVSRTHALSAFVVGVGYYVAHDYARAKRYFQVASRQPGASGQEVISLFLGNVAGKLGDLAGAEHFYEEAQRHKPGYLRAELGLAEIAFQRSHFGCDTAKASRVGLLIAAKKFERVRRRAPAGNDGVTLIARTDFGRGRAYLCLAQADLMSMWLEAQSAFMSVVSLYRDHPALRPEASEAHGYLGLIALPPGNDRTPRPELQTAGKHYRIAVKLSQQPARQAVFYGMLGFIHRRLGDARAARAAYAHAADLAKSAQERRAYQRQARL